jgi:hypothetical protein
MTNYNDKGKVDGTSVNVVTNAVTSADGTVATVKSTSKDKKDTVLGTTNTAIKCAAGKVSIEMKSFIPTQSSSQWKNMDIKSDGSWLEIPQTLTVGMTLPEATGTMTIYNNGAVFSTMKITFSNRTVASKETVTTTAGTFECFKITQDVKMETTMMGMTIPMNSKTAEYFATNTGLVKSETFNKNSKLLGYSELTSITKK